VTIRDRLASDISFAAYEGPLYRHILDVHLDGTAIGDLDMNFGLQNCSQLDRDEIISVANVLAKVGYADANMVKSAPGVAPDFVAQSPQGKALGVEHTRAVTECPDDAAGYFLRDTLALQQLPTIAAALKGLVVFVSIDHSSVFVAPIESMTQPCPGQHMTKREAQIATEEVRRLAESGYFRELSGKPQSGIPVEMAPTLAKFRATAHVGPSLNPETFTLQPTARRFLPRKLSLYEITTRELRKKSSVAAGYVTANMPGALVIQVKVGTQDLDYDLLDHAPPDIAPFTHVAVVLWHNAEVIIAGWSRAADGSIETYVPPLAELRDYTDHELRAWADEVEALLRDRWYDGTARSGERIPRIFLTPILVQWYREWLGPGPWVSCRRAGEVIEMRFWRPERGWDNGKIETIAIGEPNDAARHIWDYIVGET
jgi:hypothetical protein